MSNRSYCYTFNNYAESDIAILKNVDCHYHVMGYEKAPSTGTPHIQGFIQLTSPQRIAGVKKLFCKNAPDESFVQRIKTIHFEPRKGTPKQAAEYCKKGGKFDEVGDLSYSGKRVDIVKEIASGTRIQDMVESLSYNDLRHAEKLISYIEQKRNWAPIVVWCYGPTGVGKTRWAMDWSKDPWISGRNLEWWQGYDAHEYVIFDDFRKDFCTFHELLRILDRYPYTVQVKGGSRQLLARYIYITSCYAPGEVYSTREDVAQLLRRINFVVEFSAGSGIQIISKCQSDAENAILRSQLESQSDGSSSDDFAEIDLPHCD